MTISLRVSNEEAEIIRSYAKLKNISISELMRGATIEQIESDLDLLAFDKALAEHGDGRVYSQAEVEKELGLHEIQG